MAPAGMAKEAGKSVLVIDGRDFGGTCALRGCVPKKVLVAAGEALNIIQDASEHKIDASFNTIDWPALIERKQTFVEGVPQMFEDSLTGRNIDIAHGAAKFTGANQIQVNGATVLGGQFVIATGSAPRNLPIPGFEHAIDSDAILELSQRPARLVYIGAGVIGLEFVHVYARAGTKVTILEVADTALAAMDSDIVGRWWKKAPASASIFIPALPPNPSNHPGAASKSPLRTAANRAASIATWSPTAPAGWRRWSIWTWTPPASTTTVR